MVHSHEHYCAEHPNERSKWVCLHIPSGCSARATQNSNDGSKQSRTASNGVCSDCRLQGRLASLPIPSCWLTHLKPSGTTTGISAHDRALTARKLAHYPSATLTTDTSPNGMHNATCRSSQNGDDSSPSPDCFSRPGHMVPLRARPGGVLTRKGHTEAALGIIPFYV